MKFKSFALALVVLACAQASWAVQQIVTAGSHTMLIRADGTLWAWGFNSDGQLGDGTKTSTTLPNQVGSGYKAVFVGGPTSAAIAADGGLWMWGKNGGLFGNGITTDSLVPVKVGSGFIAVSFGFVSAVGLKADGSLWTWGDNSYCQLGNGYQTQGGLQLLPNQIGAGFVAISTGGTRTLALKSDGSLWAWGQQWHGEVGDNLRGNLVWKDQLGQTLHCQPSPTQIGTGFSAVAAGSSHSLALKSDGSLWAWGDNSFDQLGDGTHTDRYTPTQVGTGFAAISAGSNHSLALKSDGSLWAWGWNGNGQLGDGTTTASSVPKLVGNGFVATAAGTNGVSFAIRLDGSLWAWGNNDVGQLGDGALVDSRLPEQVLPIPLRGLKSLSLSSGTLFPRFDTGNFVYNVTVGDGVTSLSVTPTATDPSFSIMVHGSAVTSGTASTAILLVVGTNTINVVANSPQLDKSWTYVLTVTRTPQAVQAVAPAFVSGLSHALVLRSDGDLWAWGRNGNGELGDGTANDATVPRQIGEGFTAISASGYVSMGVKSDGSLWTWGNGPLGEGGLQRNAPVQVATGFVTVAAGWNNGAGFKSDGSLWVWGDARWGQFADGPAPVGFLRPLGRGYSAISLGIGHLVALRSDGTLWAWGKNDFGQVGDGQSGNQACKDAFGRTILCQFVPVQIGAGFSAISAGADYGLALKQDGTLWAWGDNSAGQLGDGTTTRRLKPVQIAGNFVSIAAGLRFSAALKADGSLWVWGEAAWVGGSGIGAPLTLAPKQIATGFSAVAIGSGSILAKRTDGTLWTWGANSFGQLGSGLYVDATTPQLVVNETVTGILDLDPNVPNAIPASAVPAIILEARKKGDLSNLTLGTNMYFGSIDLGAIATGTFSASGSYKVYVAGIVPAGISGLPAGVYLLDTDRNWSYYSGGPLPEYVSNATLDQTQHYFVSILDSTDLRGLIGTRIVVGYGTDDQEMLAAQRYREIYVVQ